MKITVYTTTDCQFSKQEKEYLMSHSLPFEEKNLEINKEFLTEMLAVSNNFAGTPVTKIEKDDGQISVLKGFTKDEFDKTLGFVVSPPSVAVADPAKTTPPVPVPTPASPPTPPAPQLNSVLNDLQSKMTENTPPANLPKIPDFGTNQ